MSEEIPKNTEFEQLQEKVENLRCSLGALIVITIVLVVIESIDLILENVFFNYGIFFAIFCVSTIFVAISYYKD